MNPDSPRLIGGHPPPDLIIATQQSLPVQPQALTRARAFAEPLIAKEVLDTGEGILEHADAVAGILCDLGGSEAMQAASYLVYACDYLQKPHDVIAKAFGESYASLAVETTKLVRIQRQARMGDAVGRAADASKLQVENVRKMLLGFSRDMRVVLLRLASRLQTLRFFAATKLPVPAELARESLDVFAPLANRLGIWQLKWEIEDLSFRFLEPQTYKEVARLLDEKRGEREASVQELRDSLERDLAGQGVKAEVQGRPKHIYSIVKKMRGKALDFHHVFDVQALRVVVMSVPECYAVLAWVHQHMAPVPDEFDDYISRPKANGYQSLHTVVRDGKGRPVEIQIRTRTMHEHAEHGVAAHWAYKEAGTKGYAGVSATGEYDAKIAVLRQLLAWKRDLSESTSQTGLFDDSIYVLTPDAAIMELPVGATPVDFAYSVHTSLGHRCRGARVDGVMTTLNTPLKNGQTVEIIAAKEGATLAGPSRDWLNTDLGFLASHRARSKVRAWFNALAISETIHRGREAVEKLLQREGRTSLRHDELAAMLSFASADALFEAVGKDELSLRAIEQVLRPAEPALDIDEFLQIRTAKRAANRGGPRSSSDVLVVGMDSLLTQFAKCCKPAPPDGIAGFVTRGRGVSIHRADCASFRQIAARSPDRVIEVDWGLSAATASALYPVDISVEASDRQGLLRDISEVLAREKVNVIGVQTQSVRDNRGGTAWMTFTVEVQGTARLPRVLAAVQDVTGVRTVRRR
jgi:GTP pyrophosphokinase